MNRKVIPLTFNQYLRRRGYHLCSKKTILFVIIGRSFSQKSFLNIWRFWNPLTGYFLFILYHYLGGNKRRPLSNFLTFLISGILFHDAIIYLFTGVFTLVFTLTFFFYSIIAWIQNLFPAFNRANRRNLLRKPHSPVYVARNMALAAIPLCLSCLVNYLYFHYMK